VDVTGSSRRQRTKRRARHAILFVTGSRAAILGAAPSSRVIALLVGYNPLREVGVLGAMAAPFAAMPVGQAVSAIAVAVHEPEASARVSVPGVCSTAFRRAAVLNAYRATRMIRRQKERTP
jgi:hypothetical protein